VFRLRKLLYQCAIVRTEIAQRGSRTRTSGRQDWARYTSGHPDLFRKIRTPAHQVSF